MGIHSGMNIRITKQIGGGVNGWSYYDCCTRTKYLSEICKNQTIEVGAAKLFSVNSSRT